MARTSFYIFLIGGPYDGKWTAISEATYNDGRYYYHELEPVRTDQGHTPLFDKAFGKDTAKYNTRAYVKGYRDNPSVWIEERLIDLVSKSADKPWNVKVVEEQDAQ